MGTKNGELLSNQAKCCFSLLTNHEQHVATSASLSAARFGPRPQDVLEGLGPRKELRQLLNDSEKFEPLVGPCLTYAEPIMGRKPVPDGTVTPPPDYGQQRVFAGWRPPEKGVLNDAPT